MMIRSTGGLVRQALGLASGLLLLATLLAAPVAGQGQGGQGQPRTPPREPGQQAPNLPGMEFKRTPDAPGAESDTGKGTPPAAQKKRRSGSVVPETPARRAHLLDELYPLLATADDENEAKRTAETIERLWLIPASPTVALLMERSGRALAEKKPAVALKLLDSAASLAPDYPEVFLRRAYLHHSQNEVQRALGDLRRAIALDPNHFKAIEALAQMLKEIDQKKGALSAFRRLLEVHPFAAGAKSAMDELARELEGQEI